MVESEPVETRKNVYDGKKSSIELDLEDMKIRGIEMETVINEWPDSQECVGRTHAMFIIDRKSSTYSYDES